MIFIIAVLAVGTLVALDQITEVVQKAGLLISESEMNVINETAFYSRSVLWAIFWGSLFLVLTASFMVIHTIVNPLKNLRQSLIKKTQAQTGKDIKLSADEIEDIFQAFQMIEGRISELEDQLHKKNREVENNLRAAHEQRSDLEKVNKELDDFVYTMSHDIRAPLTGISGYADHLKKTFYEGMDARGKRSVDGIIKSTARLNQLINDILEVTRVTRVKNPYEPTDFNSIVSSVRERLEYDIERYDADISVQENLPVLVCDKIKMTGVFMNLINNAIKFSSKVSAQRPKVEIGYKDYPGYVEFYVKDNGVGIPEHLQGEIFELFKRAHSAEEYEGTGTGLSIVKASVEDQGGKIWVNSKPGYGADFHFTVPKNLEKT